MAVIYKDFTVNAPPDLVWDAIKDVGAAHTRLARGFVTDTVLSGNVRTVTFSNGHVIREQIITISDELRRFSYAASGGKASFHHAYFQVSEASHRKARIQWVTDFLPEEARAHIAQMVDNGSFAIQQTLERLSQRK